MNKTRIIELLIVLGFMAGVYYADRSSLTRALDALSTQVAEVKMDVKAMRADLYAPRNGKGGP